MTTGDWSEYGGQLDDRIIEAAQWEVLENVLMRRPIAFREAFARFVKTATPLGAERPTFDAADQGHLDRWANDPRAEEVWQKIQKRVPGSIGVFDSLDTLILTVLVTRRVAEEVPDPKAIIDQQRRRSHLFQKRAESLEDLAKAWREIAEKEGSKGAFKRAEGYEREAGAWRKFSQSQPPERQFLLSRVNKSGSRTQRFFMQAVGKYLIWLCGRPMDNVTAVLNDIAFDTDEATTVFRARSARRPSTRLGRVKSRKNVRPKIRKKRVITKR